MNATLRGAKLQSIVDGSKVSIADITTEWLKKDSRAISMICAAVNQKILEHLINYKTSEEIWNNITLIHAWEASQTVHQL